MLLPLKMTQVVMRLSLYCSPAFILTFSQREGTNFNFLLTVFTLLDVANLAYL